jgi:hypothetical protein
MDSETSYNKIKHLVKVENDIFAVFTINSKGNANGLTIAKKIDIEKSKSSVIMNIIIPSSKSVIQI